MQGGKTMTQNTTQDDKVSNEKPEIKKVQYNNDKLEHSFDQEQEYNESVHSEDEAIQIIFENGAKYRLRKVNDSEIVEETFNKNDSHSPWESNKFDAEDLVKATQVVIDEYQSGQRETYEDFNDWYMIQEVIF